MDIRSSLTIALRKRGHGPPNIQIRSRRSPFNAEAVIAGISNCVGKGRASSKKDARAAALKDLANQLITMKIISIGEVPATMGWSSGGDAASSNQAISAPSTTEQAERQDANDDEAAEIVEVADAAQADTGGDQNNDVPEGGSLAETQSTTNKGPYAVLESPPLNVGALNSSKLKQIINAFCRLVRQTKPAIRDVSKKAGKTAQGGFIVECQMRIEALGGKVVKVEGRAATKNMATNACWISFVRELFSSGAITEALAKKPSVVELSDDGDGGGKRLPVVAVKRNAELEERLAAYLQGQGVAVPPLPEGLEDASVQSPVSIYDSTAPVDVLSSPRKPATEGADGADVSRVDIKWVPPIASWDRWEASPITEGPIAGQSLEEVSANMMGHEKANERLRTKPSYPINAHREKIVSAVEEHLVTMIKAPNGSGKSTQICQYLLEKHLLAGKGAKFNCLVVEPHRFTPLVLAQCVAEERCETPGNSVGYYIDYKGLAPRPYGAVVFVNAAVLLRQLELGMQGITHVILDDVHERDAEMDLLLLLLKDLTTKEQPHLRLVLTSASGMDTKVFEDYFALGEKYGTVEVKTDEKGVVKNFFLEDVVQSLQFMPAAAKKRTPHAVNGSEKQATQEEAASTMSEEMLAEINDTYGSRVKESISLMSENEIDLALVEKLLEHIYSKQVKEREKDGCLVLVPGWQNAAALKYSVERNAIISNTRLYAIMLLHSQLSENERKRIFAKESDGKRKIVISVLGEKSGCIPHVAFIIDCCKVQSRVSSTHQMPIYVADWATKPQLLQRRNLLGQNVKEGTVYHLCARPRFARLKSTYEVEMKHSPLHEVVLPLKVLTGTVGSIAPLLSSAMDPPPVENVYEAERYLRDLGALDADGALTTLGEILARAECLHPRVGKALIQAISLGVGDLMCMLVAATAFYPPFIRKQFTKATTLYRAYSGKRVSEHIGLLKVNNKFRMVAASPEKHGSTEKLCTDRSWDTAVLTASAEAAEHLHRTMVNLLSIPRSFMPKMPGLSAARLDLLMSAVVMAYYPNVCQVESSSQYKRSVQKLNASYPPDSQPTIRVPFDTSEIPTFTSPLFVFNEEISAKDIVHLRRISMITPLQLLLFGSRKVTAVGKGVIELDDKIRVEMSPKMAGQIIALRESLETAIEEVYPPTRSIKSEMIICKAEPAVVKQEVEIFEHRPEELPGGIASKHNIELVELVKALSSEAAWTDRVSTYTTPNPPGGNKSEPSSSAKASKEKPSATPRHRNGDRRGTQGHETRPSARDTRQHPYRQRDWSNGSAGGASKRQRRSPPRTTFSAGRGRSPAPYISRQPVHYVPIYSQRQHHPHDQRDMSYHFHRREDAVLPLVGQGEWENPAAAGVTWSSLPRVLASAYGGNAQSQMAQSQMAYELMQEEETRMARILREEQQRRLQLEAEQFQRHPMRRDDYAMGGVSYLGTSAAQMPLQQLAPSVSHAPFRTPGMRDMAAEAASSRYTSSQFAQPSSNYGLQQPSTSSVVLDAFGVRRYPDPNPALPPMYSQQVPGYDPQNRNASMAPSISSMVDFINSGGGVNAAAIGQTSSNPLYRAAQSESRPPYSGWR